MKNYSFLLVAGVLLGLAVRLSGVGNPPAPFTDSVGVANAKAEDVVRFTGTVIDQKPAKDGRPLLTLQLDQGVQERVYVGDDAKAGDIRVGSAYEVQAHVLGPGMATADVGGIKPLTTSPVVVDEVVAYVAHGLARTSPTQALPTDAGDGVHQGKVMVVNGHPRFVSD